MKFGRTKSSDSNTAAAPSATISRRSSGLEQFFAAFPPSDGRPILDLSGASQANITFITNLGHRLSSEDMVGTMQECFGPDYLEGQQSAAKAQRFLDQTLKFPDQSFGGALIWDCLQFLSQPLLGDVVNELLRVTKPGGLLLVFFNADEKAARVPVYNFRIEDQKTLLQVPRGAPQRPQFFPNRTVEKLFEKAASLKFFLTRDSLREVIVRR